MGGNNSEMSRSSNSYTKASIRQLTGWYPHLRKVIRTPNTALNTQQEMVNSGWVGDQAVA